MKRYIRILVLALLSFSALVPLGLAQAQAVRCFPENSMIRDRSEPAPLGTAQFRR